MKFTCIVFGCQMNYADTARIKSVLTNCWHTFVETVEEADVVVFDTCSVRQKSEDKVTGKLKEIPTNKKVWITGCMIQHNFRNSKIANETQDRIIPGLMEKGNFLGNVVTNDPIILWFTTDEINEQLDDMRDHSNNIAYVIIIKFWRINNGAKRSRLDT